MEIDLNELTSKIRVKREAVRFCLEQGKYKCIIFRFCITRRKGIQLRVFLHVYGRKEKIAKI